MVVKSMVVQNSINLAASFIGTTLDYIKAFTDRQTLRPRHLQEEDL